MVSLPPDVERLPGLVDDEVETVRSAECRRLACSPGLNAGGIDMFRATTGLMDMLNW